jgi:hypothetical protein
MQLLLLWCGSGGGGCGPGLVSAQSSSSCPIGSFFNATTAKCATCPGGVFCVGGANPAIACPAGMRSTSSFDCADKSCVRVDVVIDPRAESRVDALLLLPTVRNEFGLFELPRHDVVVAVYVSWWCGSAGLYCPVNASFPVVCPSGSYCGASAAAPTACPDDIPLSNLASADITACSAYGMRIDRDPRVMG